MKPLLDDETFKRFEREALEFQNGIGRRLQRYLCLKSMLSSNYVSDWWEEYVYLRGRTPIMVNSNFYALDSAYRVSTNVQAALAANCIAAAFMYRRQLASENLKPIMVQDTVPLCSRQYERQFNTTRIPGEVTDKIVHLNDSKHVAVYSKGKWYKLYTYYQSQPLNAKELEMQIQKILDDESEPSKCEKYLGALTAGDRVPWAQARKKHFSKGVNKVSLSSIEKVCAFDTRFCFLFNANESFTIKFKFKQAAFVVALDEESYEISKVFLLILKLIWKNF